MQWHTIFHWQSSTQTRALSFPSTTLTNMSRYAASLYNILRVLYLLPLLFDSSDLALTTWAQALDGVWRGREFLEVHCETLQNHPCSMRSGVTQKKYVFTRTRLIRALVDTDMLHYFSFILLKIYDVCSSWSMIYLCFIDCEYITRHHKCNHRIRMVITDFHISCMNA